MTTIRRTGARSTALAALLAAGLTLAGTAGCSDDAGKTPTDDKKKTAQSEGKGSGSDDGGGETVPDTSQVLVTIKGSDGLDVIVNSATRDEGGFITVMGQMKNTTGRSERPAVALHGDETEIIKHGVTLGGATLVDSAGKKRYYILRDTEGRPLATKFSSSIKAGESIPVYMQFPAPPDSTTKVGLQIPTYPTATIELS
ncbi:hypothetical protein ACFQLX_03505 [Streptomyces polyrhachis]|uniref:Secreted protein n=1 Tax=Streptomyces polyrhachis TaxID=1282885 RepID=A0ABW2GEQ5_9ACTN